MHEKELVSSLQLFNEPTSVDFTAPTPLVSRVADSRCQDKIHGDWNLHRATLHVTALIAGWPCFLQGEGCGCTGAHDRERGRPLPSARGRPQVRPSLGFTRRQIETDLQSPLKPAPALLERYVRLGPVTAHQGRDTGRAVTVPKLAYRYHTSLQFPPKAMESATGISSQRTSCCQPRMTMRR